MLSEIALATMIVAANPSPGLPITGVSVQNKMPAGTTHVEAPPLRAYKVQAAPEATASATPAPHRRH